MVATFTRLRSGKANSLGASAVQNNNHRLQQDVDVEPDGPVSNIEEILRLEARSGTRRGDCETATTKRVKRPKRYPTEARSRTIMQKADAFRRDVCYGIFRQSGIRFAVGKCSIWLWVI